MIHPRIAAISVLAVGALVLTGCTGTPEPEPTPSESATAAEQTPGITDIQDVPGSDDTLTGALADSSVTTCELAGDEWNVAGTVTNPTDGVANYRIYVSLLAGDGNTLALKQVNVDSVAPVVATEWGTSIPVTEADLSCVLRVERYEVEG